MLKRIALANGISSKKDKFYKGLKMIAYGYDNLGKWLKENQNKNIFFSTKKKMSLTGKQKKAAKVAFLTREEERISVDLFCMENGSRKYWEVFLRTVSPKCIDFEKRIYSDTEFKESYPLFS